jgi:hypothetical protein
MIRKLLSLFAVLAFGLTLSYAQVQAGLGAVAGQVTDPTKAAIPGAKVVLSNPGTGYTSTATTNAAGEFQFGALNVVGGYMLTVTASGFARSQVKNIATSVGTVVTQNVVLPVGAESTTVEVQANNIEQVQTDTAQVSQLIDSQVISQSPMLFRDTNQLVGLTAGAAADSAGTGRGYAVNGARTGTGNFLLNGFDDNDQGLGGGGSFFSAGALVSLSPDAVQEYRVLSSVPDAEYGRAGGFTTDIVMKSGTNTWHGSLFEYNRIQALAQNNFFSKRAGLQDHQVFNQFGGSVGGRIYKDRTYFFSTIELFRDREGSPLTFTGITQDFFNFVKSGSYEKFMEGTLDQNLATITDPNTGGTIDGEGFCPVYLGTTCPGGFADVATTGATFNKLYAQSPQEYPFGTRNFTNIPTDLYSGDTYYFPVNVYGDGDVIQTSVNNANRGSIRVDHRLTGADQLSFTYAVEEDNDTYNNGGGGGTPGPMEVNYGGAQIFGARWTHTFTSNLLNDFRAGYLRHVRNFAAGDPGISDMEGADSATVGFGAYSGFPQLFTENEFSYEDALSYVIHRHNIKGGFRFVRTRNGSSFYNDNSGTVYYWGQPGMLTDGYNEQDAERLLDGGTTGGYHNAYGTLYYLSGSEDPSTGSAPDPYRGYRANEFNAYVEDSLKVTPKLFVSYGVRWDYFGPPHNFQAGVDSNVYFGTATSVATANPFAPGGTLYLGEQSASFRCVGFNPCGNPAAAPAGYALASGSSTIWDRDMNNFAPRVGFSYDTTGTGKLVVRGGFGIGFDRLYNNVYENIRFNAPHFVDSATGYGAGATGISEALRAAAVVQPFTANGLLPTGAAVPRHVNQNLKTAYYEQAHFGIETNVLKGYVIEANYIGTFGRQLVGLMNANTFEGRVACSSAAQQAACAAAGLTTAQMSTARPNSTFGNDNFRTNGFSSNYNGGQVRISRGYAHGFQISGNYTYSKAMDEISDVFTVKGGATGIVTPYNPSHAYGPADFDVRHQFNLTANYRSQSAAHRYLIGGWGVSPIFTARSGTPVYMKDGNSSYDPNKDGTTGVEWIVYTGAGSLKNSINHSASPAGNGTPGTGFINKTGWTPYTCPASVNHGLFCDVPGDRNSMYGLRQYDLDLQVSKTIPLYERFSLTLQAAFFNADGHTQFGNPNGDINSTSFGESTSAGIRQGQLSARIEF